MTVPFSAGAVLSGRLVRADGAGIADRELRVVSRPSRGAVAQTRVDVVHTGSKGGFELALPAGPSRRITVDYGGDEGSRNRAAPRCCCGSAAGSASTPRPARCATARRFI